jgi:hypothetical protein
MTKKITTVCCTVVLLATTVATPALSQSKNFVGGYVGLGVTQNSQTTEASYTDGTDSLIIDHGKHNTIPVLDASYSFSVSNDVLLRFGGTYDLGKSKSGKVTAVDGGETTTDTLSYSYKDHYSIYIAPTIVLSPNNALFAKLGYHKQKGTLKYTTTDQDDVSYSKNFEGWGYGVGYLHTFGNIYLQLEGQFIDYKKKTITDDPDIFSFKPENLGATISVGYKF